MYLFCANYILHSAFTVQCIMGIHWGKANMVSFLILTWGPAYWFERERGREGEKRRCVPRRDWTQNLGMCPDQDSSLQPFSLRDDTPTNWATPARAKANMFDLQCFAPCCATLSALTPCHPWRHQPLPTPGSLPTCRFQLKCHFHGEISLLNTRWNLLKSHCLLTKYYSFLTLIPILIKHLFM